MLGILPFVRVVNHNCLFKNVKNDKPGHERDQHRGRSDAQRSSYAKCLGKDIKETHPQQHPDRKALYVMQMFALS